jgi:plasmid maintenance system killer protein
VVARTAEQEFALMVHTEIGKTLVVNDLIFNLPVLKGASGPMMKLFGVGPGKPNWLLGADGRAPSCSGEPARSGGSTCTHAMSTLARDSLGGHRGERAEAAPQGASLHRREARRLGFGGREAHGLEEIRKVPGYHDEPLKGKHAGQHSIRLSRAYRASYMISHGALKFVSVEEVHKHDY